MNYTDFIVPALVLGAVAVIVFLWRRRRRNKLETWLPRVLYDHFFPTPLTSLNVVERRFPFHMRVDVQRALTRALEELESTTFRCVGATVDNSFFTGMKFSNLCNEADASARTINLEYEDVDVGAETPARCPKTALWLARIGRVPMALLFSPQTDFCRRMDSISVQLGTINDEAGSALSERLLEQIEQGVAQSSCYRGKILSFEERQSYDGTAVGLIVHRLRKVAAEDVILPADTRELMDRNVIQFVKQRPRLRELKFPTKKGLLLHGPPGTGKTHTIHYLAGSLPDHTVFLISAEQVVRLTDYMTLARLLQPSLVVIEDVDLIARDRTTMRDPNEEVLLNKLLNEMDGLREDAEILFILTSNRPESLEAAVAARPGRIDQAIEFPLPDEEGRRRLVRLYSGGLQLEESLLQQIAARTTNVSAAFIKELMRRSVQFHLGRDGDGRLEWRDVDAALNEVLFRGGVLNRLLLGATEHAGA